MPKGPESFNDGDANESVHPCVALSRLTALCGHRLINLYCIPLGEGEKLKVIKHCKKSHPPRKLMKISLIGMQSEHRAFHRCARERQEAARPFRSAKHRRRLLKPPDLMGPIIYHQRVMEVHTGHFLGFQGYTLMDLIFEGQNSLETVSLSFVWMLKIMLPSFSPLPQQTLGGKASRSPNPIFQKWGCLKRVFVY